MARPTISVYRARPVAPQFAAAAKAIHALSQHASSPFHRHLPAGFRRGIDFYSGFDLLHAMANGMHGFHAAHGHYPDLLEPRTYAEKLFWRKFLALTPIPGAGDKLALAGFIPPELRTRVLLPEIVWRSAIATLPANDAIPPGWYFLKASHGCRYHARVRFPLSPEERPALVQLAARWLGHAYGHGDGEWWYSLVPRRIFLERSLCEDAPIITWCLVVANQTLAGVLATKRIGSASHVAWLRPDLSVHDGQDADDLAQVAFTPPTNFPDVAEAALAIARPFNFVRVDFHLVGPDIYLSELTLSPGNALGQGPPAFDQAISRAWRVLD
ncbi:hypothetical protein STAQ_15970 [Allostella sp. ATCC 35155]|nr:hypothetical protein STAQ_15970 [Stella sp. ATCC 35155]